LAKNFSPTNYTNFHKGEAKDFLGKELFSHPLLAAVKYFMLLNSAHGFIRGNNERSHNNRFNGFNITKHWT
jgi:hypothetical protein